MSEWERFAFGPMIATFLVAVLRGNALASFFSMAVDWTGPLYESEVE